LHIDGLHTYEAVSHDFHTWYPKVKPGGVVLLHDISARHSDFGVSKFWDEVQCLGNCFSFRHSWGLGIHQKPGESKGGKLLLQTLFASTPEYKEYVRKFYSLCALKLEHQHYGEDKSRIHVQTFPYLQDGYSVDAVINSDLAPESWQELFIDITPSAGNGPLRFDPTDRPGVIEISSIAVRSLSEDHLLWEGGPAEIANLSTGGTIIRLPTHGGEDCCRLLSYGSDPQIFLPSLDDSASRSPVVLRVRMRIQSGLASLIPLLQPSVTPSQAQPNTVPQAESMREPEDTAVARQAVSLGEYKPLEQTHREMTAGYQELKAHAAALLADRDSLFQECEAQNELKQAYQTLAARYDALRAETAALLAERDSLLQEREAQNELKQAYQTLAAKYDTLTADTAASLAERDSLLREGKSLAELIKELKNEHQDLTVRWDNLSGQMAALTNERDSLLWERDSLAASFKTQQRELYIIKTEVKRTAAAMPELQKDLATTKSQLLECQARRAELEETLKGVLKSRSWRLTAPMRDWAVRIRGS
jgi:uncharacterized coiled-coil DUF342 family protein